MNTNETKLYQLIMTNPAMQAEIAGATNKEERIDVIVLSLGQRVRSQVRMHDAFTGYRRDDDKSYQTILNRGLTEVDTTENQAEWEDVGRQVRERLAGRVYPKSLLDAVIAAAGSEE